MGASAGAGTPESQTQAPVVLPPPDGGLRAWLQILAGHLINCLTWGYTASFGVYQLYYTTTLNLPPSQVSWIGSIQIFLTFFVGTVSGRSADAGYAQWTVLLGSTLLVLGTFLTSVASTYWQVFLAYGLCTGLGMGILYMPAVAVIGSYWQKRKAMALGMAASGSGTGGIIFPLILQNLQHQIGFPNAVRVQACIAAFFAIVINILLRPRLPPRKSGPLVEWSAFREPTYALFTAGMFLIFWALYFCFFYINTFATDPRVGIGLSDVAAVNLAVVISAIGIPVRPLLGWAADRHLGALPTLIVSSAILGAVFFIWIPVRSVGGLYGWSVSYGLATGATQGIFVGALASLTKEANKMGTRFGMVCSVLAFASLAGPPTAGALIQSDGGGFLRTQIWGGAVTVAGAGLLGAAYWFSVKKERLAAGVPMMHFGLPRRKQPETNRGGEQGDQVGAKDIPPLLTTYPGGVHRS
ncbi:putative monocarboxylate permease [Coniochaeta ligniaria NRRL 30616]|uniref:Putative monocarboxylate permease n=1 Tax=Coniochaeta ligniaria NRRL 30616 TaxID=1408157 RepID=A0A1J7ILK0_9PEZI|nr:putative monocarboxylate permease [Coniochaeta ligniaria NRRL 30616]